jgi:hypothetical protein
MLKVNYNYSGKNFTISPYNTSQEKDILLLSTVGESDMSNALSICGIEDNIICELTNDEKVAMLFKLREISVGEDVHLKFKCKYCSGGNENHLKISRLIESSKITNEKIKDQFVEILDDNIQDFFDFDIDELDVEEYEVLFKEVLDTVTKFNFKKPIICQKCRKENYIRINNPKFVIDNLSEDSLISLYQTYNDLVFFGKYTKEDVDTLYPFERTIFMSLLNKTREDMNK